VTAQSLLLSAVFAPFLGALVAPYLGRWFKARAAYLLTLCFLPTLLLVPYASNARAGQPLEASLAWVPSIGLEIGLRADGFSLMFALLVAGIGVLILAYAAAYLGTYEKHGRFLSYLLIFGGAMLGLVLADNLIALFAFWEMTSLSSFLLIGFWGSRKASQDGAEKALVITALGGLALLVAVALLGIAGGTLKLSELELATLQQSPLFVPSLILLLLAAFTKSAQLPFHLWLPTAMEAPTPVSAFLHSATMVKAGVILVAKFGFLLEYSVFSELVLYVGLATMFWGSYLALRQNDLKALLAYSTVSQLGILMALYGSGHAFAATAHLLNHAAFKAALFMVVGIIDHETGSRDISKLSGLRRKLPITYLIALPAVLSMSGIPFLGFGGFISKELFYEEMLHEGFLPILIAVTGSIMTFAYCGRFIKVFWWEYRCEKPNLHEAKVLFWLPPALLALSVVAFGYLPLGFTGNPFKSTTVATWFTNLAGASFGFEKEKLYVWHGFNLALGLSFLTAGLGSVLHFNRDRFHALQQVLTPNWNMNTLYYAFLEKLEYFASWFINKTQGATFATHLRLIFIGLALIGFSVFWVYIPTSLSPVPLVFWLIAVMIVVDVVGVLSAENRLSAIIFAGLAGLASTLTFVMLSAPDLALTQLLIETVTVILFLSVFRFLPRLTNYTKPRYVTIFDALLSLAVAATVFTTLVAVQTPIAERIKDYYLEFSKSLAGGYNVVNVILVDFRGYDTMGEITVLAVVAVSVIALLRIAVKRVVPQEDSAKDYDRQPDGGDYDSTS
jgi:multicomponent K+:H+ antiporter subunit A/multicomponent Na+:H+ antiporter subunit A